MQHFLPKFYQILLITTVCCFIFPKINYAQSVDEDKFGAWYMYFYNKKFSESRFGIQGDFQFRYWNFGSDLEQRLLRSGLTYNPKNTNVTLTFGYGNIATGTPGDSKNATTESRIYQEALLPHKISSRIRLTHRFRYEQRWVENNDFRTRFRYNLFLNILLNKNEMVEGTVYLALYNELFINGQLEVGEGRQVQYFDRNRSYAAIGYALKNNLRVQIGVMKQTTVNWSKSQLQFSLHHSI